MLIDTYVLQDSSAARDARRLPAYAHHYARRFHNLHVDTAYSANPDAVRSANANSDSNSKVNDDGAALATVIAIPADRNDWSRSAIH